jgi:hypothetical protein
MADIGGANWWTMRTLFPPEIRFAAQTIALPHIPPSCRCRNQTAKSGETRQAKDAS